MSRPAFYVVEMATARGMVTSRVFRTLLAARRWARRLDVDTRIVAQGGVVVVLTHKAV